MTQNFDLKLLVPAPVRRFPSDLAVVVISVFVTYMGVLLPGVSDSPVRPIIAFPFVFFVPGYAFIAALFPEAADAENRASSTESKSITEHVSARFETGIDGPVRVALSFGASIAIVPLIGLILNYTPWGIRLLPALTAIGGFTILMAVVGALRRWNLPKDERFNVPFRQRSEAIRRELFEPETRTDAALNVVLVVSLLLATVSVTYVVAMPSTGDRFTEFYLLTKNESGSYVAADYPTNFTVGRSKPVYVGLQNHEHERKNYTVVVLLQRVKTMNDSATLQREQELARFHPTVKANGRWRTKHSVSPRMTGNRLRLQYLLYKGNTPHNPSEKNSYREAHLWVNVSKR